MNPSLEGPQSHFKPQLKSYLSAVKYLADYYQFRKSQETRFSYELWSIEFGFKSKSSFRMVCQGQKKFTDSFVDTLAQNLKWTEDEKDYFYLLAQYQNAQNIVSKKAYLDKIVAQMDTSKYDGDIHDYINFLSSPLVPVLQLLISFPDFLASEDHLKKTLGLDQKQLTSYLKILENLGLVQPHVTEAHKTPVWTSQQKSFKIPDKLHDEALNQFHQQTTQEAYEILNQKIIDKKFKSLFFAMSELNYSDFNIDLEEFIKKMKYKYSSDFVNQKKMYKMNLQLYPVSQKIGEDED